MSLVSSISIAALRPTARDSATIGVEQNRPMLTPGVANRAVSAASARSQLATSWHPAAVAMPWTRAMTGTRSPTMRCIRAEHWVNSAATPSRSSPRSSRRSCPAQKAGPAPAITATRMAGSASMAVQRRAQRRHQQRGQGVAGGGDGSGSARRCRPGRRAAGVRWLYLRPWRPPAGQHRGDWWVGSAWWWMLPCDPVVLPAQDQAAAPTPGVAPPNVIAACELRTARWSRGLPRFAWPLHRCRGLVTGAAAPASRSRGRGSRLRPRCVPCRGPLQI